MLSAEQIKKLISVNESLQVQLEDINAILAAREEEIAFLHAALANATALRSEMDGQQDEIESFRYQLYKKDQQAEGAVDREISLQQELTEMARLNNKYNELLRDHADLSSRFTDVQDQVTVLLERNFQLQQIAGRIGELESRLENTLLERDDLKSRITILESQKYLREFNL